MGSPFLNLTTQLENYRRRVDESAKKQLTGKDHWTLGFGAGLSERLDLRPGSLFVQP
jgi:hypothetical protein